MFSSKLPQGQSWFINRMLTIFPNASRDGICLGMASMGVQACLAKNLSTFNKRLEIIEKIPTSEFAATIAQLKMKRTALVREVKNKIIGQHLSQEEQATILQSAKLKSALEELRSNIAAKVKKGQLEENQQEAEYQERSDLIKLNYLVKGLGLNLIKSDSVIQKAIEAELSKLPEEERIKMDIPIFLEGVQLYQSSYLYPHLYDQAAIAKYQQDVHIQATAELVWPASLESQSLGVDMHKLASFSGVYSRKELATYVKSLNKFLQATKAKDQAIAFSLISGNHAICAGYDVEKKSLFLIDANKLDKRYLNAEELSQEIFTAYEPLPSALTKNAIFSTEIFVNKSNQAPFEEFLTTWQNQDEWKKIQKVNPKKAKTTDFYHFSWLHLATRQCQSELVAELIENGASPNEASISDGSTPLIFAAKEGHSSITDILLAKKANPNISTPKGLTPLMTAAESSHLTVIQTLLANGADPNRQMKNGDHALSMAARNGHTDTVITLLANGAKPDLADLEGHTPLHYAAARGHLEIVQALLAKGADVNRVNKVGWSPLKYATDGGHLNIIQALLTAGADPNIRNDKAFPPLFSAAAKDDLNALEALLDKGANPDAVQAKGETPLFFAAQQGSSKVVPVLISRGADVSKTYYTNPLLMREFAKKHHVEKRMEAYLKSKSLDNNFNIAVSPEEIARIMGHKEIADLIKAQELKLLAEKKNQTEKNNLPSPSSPPAKLAGASEQEAKIKEQTIAALNALQILRNKYPSNDLLRQAADQVYDESVTLAKQFSVNVLANQHKFKILNDSLACARAVLENPSDQKAIMRLQDDADHKTHGRPSLWKKLGGALLCLAGMAILALGIFATPFTMGFSAMAAGLLMPAMLMGGQALFRKSVRGPYSKTLSSLKAVVGKEFNNPIPLKTKPQGVSGDPAGAWSRVLLKNQIKIDGVDFFDKMKAYKKLNNKAIQDEVTWSLEELKDFIQNVVLHKLPAEHKPQALEYVMKNLLQETALFPLAASAANHLIKKGDKEEGITQKSSLNLVTTDTGIRLEETLDQYDISDHKTTGPAHKGKEKQEDQKHSLFHAQLNLDINFCQKQKENGPFEPTFTVERNTITYGNKMVQQIVEKKLTNPQELSAPRISPPSA